MNRPFKFNENIKRQARLRQSVNGRTKCAVCSENLENIYEHAHHVVPNQSGDVKNQKHIWLKMAENCVILCETCHDRVHENGNYRSGAIAPPNYYKFSHGGNIAAHRQWVKLLDLKIIGISS